MGEALTLLYILVMGWTVGVIWWQEETIVVTGWNMWWRPQHSSLGARSKVAPVKMISVSWAAIVQSLAGKLAIQIKICSCLGIVFIFSQQTYSLKMVNPRWQSVFLCWVWIVSRHEYKIIWINYNRIDLIKQVRPFNLNLLI